MPTTYQVTSTPTTIAVAGLTSAEVTNTGSDDVFLSPGKHRLRPGQSRIISPTESALTVTGSGSVSVATGAAVTSFQQRIAASAALTATYAPIGVGNVAGGRRAVAMGDSITAGAPGANWFEHMCFTSGGRFFRAANLGIAGDTTEGMLTRWDSQVPATSPNYLFILAGANNLDDPDYTRAWYIDRIATMVDKTRLLGAVPIVLSLIPNTNSRAKVAAFNRALASMCAAKKVRYIDVYTPLVDPATGTFIAGYSADGTHPTAAGYKVMASTVLAACADLGVPDAGYFLPGENSDSANLLTNPLFLTDSNADGLANSFTVVNADASYTRSLVAGTGAVKGNWQRNTMANGTTYQTINQTTNAGFSAGDQIMACGRFAVSGFSGQAQWQMGYITGSGSTYNYVIQNSFADGAFLVENQFTVPAGTTWIGIFWQLKSASGTSSGVIDAAQVGLYNLTTAGSLSY